MKVKSMLLVAMLLLTFSRTAHAQCCAPADISGTITDGANPLPGVVLQLSGSGGQSRIVITNASGQYIFAACPVNVFYVITPQLANYSFSPSQRAFSLLGTAANQNFTGSLGTLTSSPLDTAEFFVRQQYVDLLKREPDESGLNFWSADLKACTTQTCKNGERRHVMCAFIASGEYQARFTGTSITVCQ